MNKEDLKKIGLDHLESKQVRISDLIRYINNRNSKNNVPNYSLLLGAGASKTSGIKSGQDLIEVWKKDLCTMEGIDDPDSYLLRPENRSWYNQNNVYGSLFEKMYSLQKQRRQFVENEVQDKNPSIGYAYLVNLMSNNVFNTVFTTNFDDLISEAFYCFSSERPIVCAHDSSISSISVTSSHPKIIKLHGDYLFDNIKATVRETESLEDNMRMKVQEFAKDFGLIVIGYSGNDRSVMDILSYLLTKDEYFKNGIFWCIRKGDRPCAELINLLSKERVYFLEIDGFDEFMAELNSKLNEGRLPINEGFLSYQHQDSLIKSLIENPFVQSSSSLLLKDDCEKLKEQVKDNKLNDFLKFSREQTWNDEEKSKRYTERRIPFGKLSNEQKARIDRISFEAFALGNNLKAKQIINEEDIFNLEPSRYKIEILELYADINTSMDDQEKIRLFDALIDLDPNNSKHYLIAASRFSNPQNELYYLLQAEKRFINSVSIKNRIASALLTYYESYMDRKNYDADLLKAKDEIDASLGINPNLGNEAWVLKARWLLLVYSNDRERLKEQSVILIKECRDINPKHINTLAIIELLGKKEYDERLLKDSLDYYKLSTNNENVEEVSLRLISLYEKSIGIDKAIEAAIDYEEEYEPSSYYYISKSQLLLKHEYFQDAITQLKHVAPSDRTIAIKMEAYSCLGDTEAMERLFNDNAGKSMDIDSVYYSYNEDFNKIVELYASKFNDSGTLSTEDIVSYSYSLLQTHKYKECVELLRQYYQLPVILSQELYINYLFAANHLPKNDRDNVDANTLQTKVKDRIINAPEKSDAVLAAAYALLENQSKCFEHISKVVTENPRMKYVIKQWPVVQKYAKLEKFRELIKPDIKTIKMHQ